MNNHSVQAVKPHHATLARTRNSVCCAPATLAGAVTPHACAGGVLWLAACGWFGHSIVLCGFVQAAAYPLPLLAATPNPLGGSPPRPQIATCSLELGLACWPLPFLQPARDNLHPVLCPVPCRLVECCWPNGSGRTVGSLCVPAQHRASHRSPPGAAAVCAAFRNTQQAAWALLPSAQSPLVCPSWLTPPWHSCCHSGAGRLGPWFVLSCPVLSMCCVVPCLFVVASVFCWSCVLRRGGHTRMATCLATGIGWVHQV